MEASVKLAYLAGILDGEGYFSIVFHKARLRHFANVGVMNTSTDLIDWLQANYGGRVYKRTNPPDKSYWKDRYEWKICNSAIDALVPEVMPYLVIKRQQAELVMLLRQSIKANGRNRMTDDLLHYRESIRLALSKKNDRRNHRT